MIGIYLGRTLSVLKGDVCRLTSDNGNHANAERNNCCFAMCHEPLCKADCWRGQFTLVHGFKRLN